jgi:hypothetical protein
VFPSALTGFLVTPGPHAGALEFIPGQGTLWAASVPAAKDPGLDCECPMSWPHSADSLAWGRSYLSTTPTEESRGGKHPSPSFWPPPFHFLPVHTHAHLGSSELRARKAGSTQQTSFLRILEFGSLCLDFAPGTLPEACASTPLTPRQSPLGLPLLLGGLLEPQSLLQPSVLGGNVRITCLLEQSEGRQLVTSQGLHTVWPFHSGFPTPLGFLGPSPPQNGILLGNPI